jgi:Holliday junction resolvasome RuvABC DNA-binding subunit
LGTARSKLDAAVLRTQATTALTGMGWKPAIAHAAVDAVLAAERSELTLEELIVEALRRCPVPKA